MFAYGIGGGGTSGGEVTDDTESGGERMAVFTVICGAVDGFSRDVFRCPENAEGGGAGYEFAVTSGGRPPGCDDARIRPFIPRL